MRWIAASKDFSRHCLYDDMVQDQIVPLLAVVEFRQFLETKSLAKILQSIKVSRLKVEAWAFGVTVPGPHLSSAIEQLGGPTVREWDEAWQALQWAWLSRQLQRLWAARVRGRKVRVCDLLHDHQTEQVFRVNVNPEYKVSPPLTVDDDEVLNLSSVSVKPLSRPYHPDLCSFETVPSPYIVRRLTQLRQNPKAPLAPEGEFHKVRNQKLFTD